MFFDLFFLFSFWFPFQRNVYAILYPEPKSESVSSNSHPRWFHFDEDLLFIHLNFISIVFQSFICSQFVVFELILFFRKKSEFWCESNGLLIWWVLIFSAGYRTTTCQCNLLAFNSKRDTHLMIAKLPVIFVTSRLWFAFL